MRVAAAGAYGPDGHFSFPAVAPNAALLYDVELLSVERADASAPQAVRPRGDMLWEERMAAAARYRDDGNEVFRSGDAAAALAAYVAGLTYVDDGLMAQLMGTYLAESSALKAALHANAAAAALGLRRWDDALAQAGAALVLAPRHAKALFRKGRAHAALGQDDAARAAFARAAEIDPADAAVKAALRELDECVRAGAARACLRLRLRSALMGALRRVRVCAQGGARQGARSQAHVRGLVWRCAAGAAAAAARRRGGGCGRAAVCAARG